MEKNVYLASKPRYEILDGLRGVAAVFVLVYHLCETHFGLGAAHPLNHGYLAVDFFFALFGFVIGYAYDDRWDRMTTWAFFKRRLIRLHPMVICGSVIGALLLYFQQCDAFPGIAQSPWWLVVLAMLWSFTMIPVPKGLEVRGWGETNPLNGPTWSLQWEYLANILYALVIRRLSTRLLACCVCVFAVFTVMLCMQIDLFGLLAERADVMRYTVIGGWSTEPEHLQVGLTRLLYPFFCGLLISRLMNGGNRFFTRHSSLFTLKGGFWWCTLLILAVLSMPRFGGDEGAMMWTNGVYNAVVILLVLPLIVSIGAGSSVTGARSSAINRFLGEISFPLYITHYPLIHLQVQWTVNHPDAPASTHVFVAVCVFIASILLAYATYKLYDLPVREWLKQKLFHQTEKPLKK